MSTNHFSTEAPWWAHQYHHHQHMMEPSLKPSSRNQKKTSIFSNSHQIFPHPMNFNNSPSLTLNLNHEDYHNNDTSNEDLEDHIVKEETIGTKEGKTQESHYGEEKFIPIKEFLFEKPLTPSDVGKLNRLVIPKQHAEKYFPLNGSNNINNHNNNNNNDNNNNESGVEKGLLLSFEDELGKTWKFRYSYWNSSQSYVLTKGWSRFVKEKKLDAGDIVLFERHRRFDGDRFCIGWRRRGTPAAQPPSAVANGGSCGGGGGGWNHVFYPHPSESSQHQHPYQPDCLHAGSNVQNHLGSQSIGQLKTLRLFGVNMECQTDDVESEPDTSDGSTMAIQGSAQYQFYHHQDQQYYYSKLNGYDHHNHMDMNISGDVKHMRYRLG